MVDRDGFLDNLAKFGENGFLVSAVASTVDQPWRTSDVALVFVRPFDNFRVSGTLFHDFDSSTARFYGTNLVVLRIIGRRTGYSDHFGNLRVDEVSVTALAASIYEACPLKSRSEMSSSIFGGINSGFVPQSRNT